MTRAQLKMNIIEKELTDTTIKAEDRVDIGERTVKLAQDYAAIARDEIRQRPHRGLGCACRGEGGGK